jgi:hypothetical protein
MPYGRQSEIQFAVRAVEERRAGAVEVVAPCGFGKSTLLRYLAGHAGVYLGRPGVYLVAGNDQPGDVLQRLAGAAYGARGQRIKLTSGEAARLLVQARAVICLDDVGCTTPQLAWLLRALSGCAVVLASDRPRLERYVHHLTLAGLSDADAAALIVKDLGRSLTQAERAAVSRVVTAVHGQPLRLRQAAALVRAGEQSFAALAQQVGSNPTALDRLSVGGLPEVDRRLLATLAMLSGAFLPADLISVISGVHDVVSGLRDLRNRALVDRDDDRFGLPVCRAKTHHAQALDYVGVGQAAREIATWLTTQDPGSDASISAASAALSLIGFAAERRQWETVVLLVRVAEPVLTLAGRWERCQHVLQLGVHAAQALSDRASEALFLHQQGTLAVCLQRPPEAQQCLSRAAQLRQEIGDAAGAALSRYNLSQLILPQRPPIQPPVPLSQPTPPPASLRRLVVIAGVIVGVLAVSVTTVAALNRPPPAAPIAGRPSITPTTTVGPRVTTRATGTTPTRDRSSGSSRTSATTTAALRPPVIQPGRHAFLRLNISPGHPTLTQVFTVTNPNDRPLAMKPARVSGDTAFTVTQDGCAGSPQSGSCEVTVAFNPARIGDHAGTLTVDTLAGSASATLTGIGFARLTVHIVDQKGNEVSFGTVTAAGLIDCPPACTAKIQDAGQAHIVLTETPLKPGANGSHFVGWQGPCSGTGTTCVVDLERDVDVSAAFEFVVG